MKRSFLIIIFTIITLSSWGNSFFSDTYRHDVFFNFNMGPNYPFQVARIAMDEYSLNPEIGVSQEFMLAYFFHENIGLSFHSLVSSFRFALDKNSLLPVLNSTPGYYFMYSDDFTGNFKSTFALGISGRYTWKRLMFLATIQNGYNFHRDYYEHVYTLKEKNHNQILSVRTRQELPIKRYHFNASLSFWYKIRENWGIKLGIDYTPDKPKINYTVITSEYQNTVSKSVYHFKQNQSLFALLFGLFIAV